MCEGVFALYGVVDDLDTAVKIFLCGRTLGQGVVVAFYSALGVGVKDLTTVLEDGFSIVHTAVYAVVPYNCGRAAVVRHLDGVDAVSLVYEVSLIANPLTALTARPAHIVSTGDTAPPVSANMHVRLAVVGTFKGVELVSPVCGSLEIHSLSLGEIAAAS